MVQGHWTPFTERHSVGEEPVRLGQGEKKYAPDNWSNKVKEKKWDLDKDFTDVCYDLETWFKETAYPFLTGSLVINSIETGSRGEKLSAWALTLTFPYICPIRPWLVI